MGVASRVTELGEIVNRVLGRDGHTALYDLALCNLMNQYVLI
jgi:hypothetical protein